MAILFDDASSQYLEYAGAVAATTPLTMACWFNSDSLDLSQILMSLGTNGGVARQVLVAAGAVGGDPIEAQSVTSGGAISAGESASGYSADTWHHAGGVWSSATSRIAYLDGVAGATNTVARATSADRTTIGARWSTTLGAFLSGKIGEAAIWTAALTTAELVILAKGFSPLFVRPGSLVAYWPMMGRNDPSRDLIGGAALTWTNTPTVAAHPRIIYPRRQIFVPDYTAVTPPASSPRLLGLLGVGI